MRKRRNRIEFTLNDKENERLEFISTTTRLTKSELLRQLLMSCEVREAAPIEYHRLIREVRIVGNNINRLLMIANAGGYHNTSEIQNALEQLREVEQLIRAEFTKK